MRGFTLMELLAVIVILAIITLIAVPILMHIINDTKDSSAKESVKLYMGQVEKTIVKYQLSHSNFNSKECIINDGNLVCDNTELKIDVTGMIPKSGKITIENNKISYRNVFFEDEALYYHKSKDGIEESSEEPKLVELIKDIGNEGPSIGDEYTYEVKPGTTYNFNILSIDGTGDNRNVNLMMNKSICIDDASTQSGGGLRPVITIPISEMT